MAAAAQPPTPSSEENADALRERFNDSLIHPYIRSWYGWRLLQSFGGQMSTADHSALLEAYKQSKSIKQHTLSPYVAVCLKLPDLPVQDPSAVPPCLAAETKLLHWDIFTKQRLSDPKVPGAPTEAQIKELALAGTEELFLTASAHMKVAALQIHAHFATLSQDALRATYSKYMEVYSCYEADPINIYFEHSTPNGDARSSFAILCAFFERRLGDAFTGLIVDKSIKAPRILRELLTSAEITTLLGPDKLFVLQLMIGPAIGLNLRNVIWHGFIAEQEFHPCFLSLLLVVMASYAPLFDSHPTKKAILRPLYNLDAHNLDRYDYGSGPQVFPIGSLTDTDLSAIDYILNSSLFCLNGRVPTVMKAFRMFAATTEEVGTIYHRILVGLLPEVEHSLRRIFVACNFMPSSLLLAESRRYFTTMEMFINTKLELELPEFDSKPNLLMDELGTALSNALFDIFVYPGGYRPRDRISHGEAAVTRVPRIVADRILSLYLAISIRYSDQLLVTGPAFLASVPPLVGNCHQFYTNYLSCFHSISMLQRQLIRQWRKLDQYKTQVLAAYPFRPADDADHGDSDDHLYQFRRSEQVDLCDDVGEFTGHMRAHLAGFIASQPPLRGCTPPVRHLTVLFEDNSTHPLQDGKLLPFVTIGRPSAESSDMDATREVAKGITLMLETLTQKVTEQKDSVTQGKATKRQQASFYRLLGMLDAWAVIGTSLSLVLEMILWREPTVVKRLPAKYLLRWSGVMEKLGNKLHENQWEKALETLYDFWKDIKSKIDSIVSS